MTRKQVIAQNDLLRTRCRGGKVVWDASVRALDPQLIARAGYRMTLDQEFPDHSWHDEGSFVFAGFRFVWTIEQFAGDRTLTLYVVEDLLWRI